MFEKTVFDESYAHFKKSLRTVSCFVPLCQCNQASANILASNHLTIITLDHENSYDYNNKIIIQDDVTIALTPKEIEFFELLLTHRGNLVTRQVIENKLYIYDDAPPSALKNLVFKLRKKMNNDIIQTVGNLGYTIK